MHRVSNPLKWVPRWMSRLITSIYVAMGAKIMMGVKITYTGLEEQETLMDMGN